MIIDEFLKLKEDGAISTVRIASRSVSPIISTALRVSTTRSSLQTHRMP